MNPVNEVTEDGLPNFWIKDLPPRSTISMPINRPEIYFGEKDFRIATTQIVIESKIAHMKRCQKMNPQKYSLV